MYPDFPNTLPKKQQVVDLKFVRDRKAYAQSWVILMKRIR